VVEGKKKRVPHPRSSKQQISRIRLSGGEERICSSEQFQGGKKKSPCPSLKGTEVPSRPGTRSPVTTEKKKTPGRITCFRWNSYHALGGPLFRAFLWKTIPRRSVRKSEEFHPDVSILRGGSTAHCLSEKKGRFTTLGILQHARCQGGRHASRRLQPLR